VCFYSATFQVLTEDLQLTRSVQSTYSCIESDWRLCGQQGCIMKTMAVTYVHDMVHEMLAIKKNEMAYIVQNG